MAFDKASGGLANKTSLLFLTLALVMLAPCTRDASSGCIPNHYIPNGYGADNSVVTTW